MQNLSHTAAGPPSVVVELRLGYVWTVASVAALGGLLFGYDWVVIGGAKPFYQAYFHLQDPALVGWANSCALLGCFLGSFLAGRCSDLLGRKRVLAIAAVLFLGSSVLTGWSHSFSAFVVWRIVGGTAIGLASNVSPTYIAEISPAAWRGRLVTMNQFALVVGIVAAQLVNWRVSVWGDHLDASWNDLYGWRWMFTVVAVPAFLLLVFTPLIPESPRWLVKKGRDIRALKVLTAIGGPRYGESELTSIRESFLLERRGGTWQRLHRKPLSKLLAIGIGLAVLQQGCGINIFFNYAQEVYRRAGFTLNQVMSDIVITGSVFLAFTVVAIMLVDRLGRRRLMLIGCAGIGTMNLLASLAYRAHWPGIWILFLTLTAIAFYAMSLAPVTWVLITELFPNSVRALAVSISVGALWIASFVLTYTFPFINQSFGTSGAFLLYGSICLIGFAFVFFCVPETKCRSLEQIETLEQLR
jgi:SP family xylose:H+ symportor-like MFS transporter